MRCWETLGNYILFGGGYSGYFISIAKNKGGDHGGERGAAASENHYTNIHPSLILARDFRLIIQLVWSDRLVSQRICHK